MEKNFYFQVYFKVCTGVVNTDIKFTAGVVDTSVLLTLAVPLANLLLMSLILVVHLEL
jgi:hypothetical protein